MNEWESKRFDLRLSLREINGYSKKVHNLNYCPFDSDADNNGCSKKRTHLTREKNW